MPAFDDPRLARPSGTAVAYQVTAGVAAVRDAPAPDALLVTQALHGEIVNVFQEQGEFGLCQLPRDRYTGWVLMEALSAPVLTVTHKVSALRTYCQSEPDLKAAPRFMLCLGARLVATGRVEGKWAEFERAGWVHARHIMAVDQLEDDPVTIAERYLHTPYLWGGRESLGLDCSGLCQQVFEAAGVMLPRDSDMQAAWAGLPIENWDVPGALRRGDIVFWEGHSGLMRDPETLLHANAWHMAVASEVLVDAIERIAPIYGPPIGARRIDVALARGEMPPWLARG